jgi:hypothetical protein
MPTMVENKVKENGPAKEIWVVCEGGGEELTGILFGLSHHLVVSSPFDCVCRVAHICPSLVHPSL